MAKRKKKTTKVRTTKVSEGTGKRLTPEQRDAIKTAEGTLAEVAERFGTSINTVMRYRSGKGSRATATRSKPGPKASRRGSISVTAMVNAAGGVVIELSRKDLIKLIIGE